MLKIIIAVLLATLFVFFFTKQAEGERVIAAEIITPEVVVIKPTIKEYAEQRVLEVFGEGQWDYLDYIVSKESENWTIYGPHYPETKKSSAHGLCGFLNATWKGEKTDDPYIQIDECLVYIKDRYGDPHKAYHFHQLKNWF